MAKHIAKPHYLHIQEGNSFIYELSLYEIQKNSAILLDYKFIKRAKPMKIKKNCMIVSKELIGKNSYKTVIKSLDLISAPKAYIDGN